VKNLIRVSFLALLVLGCKARDATAVRADTANVPDDTSNETVQLDGMVKKLEGELQKNQQLLSQLQVKESQENWLCDTKDCKAIIDKNPSQRDRRNCLAVVEGNSSDCTFN
jgi:hypothetical protein